MLEINHLLKFACCVIFLQLAAPTAVLAQTNTKDSLLAIAAKEASDTARISRFLDFSEDFLLSNANYAMEFAMRALNLSREISAGKHEEKALLKVGACYYYAGIYDEAVKCYLELLKRAEVSGDKQAQLKLRINLQSIRLINEKYDSLMKVDLLESLKLAHELVSVSGDSIVKYDYIPLIYSHLAYLVQQNNDFDEAEQYLRQSLEVTRDNPRLQNSTCRTMRVYSDFLIKTGRADEAIEMIGQYRAISRNLNQTAVEATAYLQLGLAYDLKKEHARAVSNLLKGYQLMEEQDNFPLMAEIAGKLSKIYQETGRTDSSLYYAGLQHVHEEKVTLNKANENLARYEMMEQFRQLEEALKEENKIKLRSILVVLSVVASMAAGAAFLYFSIRRKYRASELAKMNVELNLEKLRLDKELLQAQLDTNQKQMATDVLYRVKKMR